MDFSRFLTPPAGITAEQVAELERILGQRDHATALDEHEVYRILATLGVPAPPHRFIPVADLPRLAELLPHCEKLVAKIVVTGITHKTDVKGVAFNVTSVERAREVYLDFQSRFPAAKFQGVLFVEQLPLKGELGDEILLSMYQDADFGPMIALGFGGVLVEELKRIMRPNRAQIFLPACMDLDENRALLAQLPLVRMIEGKVRGGKAKAELSTLVSALKKLQWAAVYFSRYNPHARVIIEELEVNPATVHQGALAALDGVLRTRAVAAADYVAPPKPLHKITRLLAPRSVAIAGASGKARQAPGRLLPIPARSLPTHSFAHAILTRPGPRAHSPCNVIARKFASSANPPAMWVLHPAEATIEGIPCVPSLAALREARHNEPVDLLLIGVRASAAAQMCEECFATHAAETILIITAGFAETAAGAHIQHDLEAKLHALDAQPALRPVINGPNTLGCICQGYSNTIFTPEYKSSATDKGHSNCALISQSGAQVITRVSDLADLVRPKVVVSVGNQMDLSVCDFLEQCLDAHQEPQFSDIDLYALYIEGLNPGDGARLMALTRRAAALHKVVCIYKTGRTEAGRDAAKGHTASMAGDYDMFSFLLRSAGALLAESFDEFEQMMLLGTHAPSLARLGAAEGPLTVGIMTNAGFEKCAMADHLFAGHTRALTLPQWGPETAAKINGCLEKAGMKGLIDISPVLDVTPMLNDVLFTTVMEIVLQDPTVDMGLFSCVPEAITLNLLPPGEGHTENALAPGGFVERVVALARRYPAKPFVMVLESGAKYDRTVAALMAGGVMCFRRADAAARALAKMAQALKKEVL
ncbi:putative acyl-CoA synthetase [Paratrimastix pyriformis]|uniref:Acyl-CoA synthetase n=1 Tax=Paratrimastix pyriformis TaxID=342808 RepID=A0ABQ8UNM6_9EUKA|nr:putative acyl-CoA synthetase [Paratrimastix pyriformis]